MATIKSLVASSQGFSTNERPLWMLKNLQRDYAELTPLTTLMSRIGSQEVDRHIFYWSNEEEVPWTITGMSAATSGDITGVTNYSYLDINDELYNHRTTEVIKIITTKPTSATIASATLTRGVGGTSAGTILPTDVLYIMSADYEEGSAEVHTRSAVKSEDYNYTAIIQHGIDTTGTAAAEKTFWGNIRTDNLRLLNRETQLKMEIKYWFGTRHQTAGAGGLNSRGFMGVGEFLKDATNYKDVNGVLTEQGFDKIISDLWTNHPGSSKFALYSSPQVINIVNAFGKDRLQTSVNDNIYGYRVKTYRASVDVDLIKVPMFASTPKTKGLGFLLDITQFKSAHLRTRAMKLIKGVQLPYADKITDITRGEVSMFLLNEKRHAMLENIAA